MKPSRRHLRFQSVTRSMRSRQRLQTRRQCRSRWRAGTCVNSSSRMFSGSSLMFPTAMACGFWTPPLGVGAPGGASAPLPPPGLRAPHPPPDPDSLPPRLHLPAATPGGSWKTPQIGFPPPIKKPDSRPFPASRGRRGTGSLRPGADRSGLRGVPAPGQRRGGGGGGGL